MSLELFYLAVKLLQLEITDLTKYLPVVRKCVWPASLLRSKICPLI